MQFSDERHATRGAVILDDGEFYIELNCNYGANNAPGFLQRRCYIGVTTAGGYECVGSFEQTVGGHWRASIDIPYNQATDRDSRELGAADRRIDAIVALWGKRHEAFCHHKEN